MRYLFIILSLFIYFSCNSNPYTESEPPYSLTIISPQEGDFVTKDLIVIADASDNVGIDYIELFIGNPQLITTLKDYNSPYEFQIAEILNNFNEGSEITLWIKASDVNGNDMIQSEKTYIFLDNDLPSKVTLSPIVNESGTIKLEWKKCNDLDFYAYVVMNNNNPYSGLDTLKEIDNIHPLIDSYDPESGTLHTVINYSYNPIDKFRIKVIDKGFKESESNSVQPISFDFITVNEFQLMSSEVTNIQYRSYLSVAKELNEIYIDHSEPFVYDNNIDKNILYNLDSGYVKWNAEESDFFIDGLTDPHIPYFPVNYVSWTGAKHFATFFDFKLPTELEWESAASNNGINNYPWGSDFNSSKANYYGNEDIDGVPEPYEPGLAPAYKWTDDEEILDPFWFFSSCPVECSGFNHMAGNVWEWVDNIEYVDASTSGYMCRGGSYKSNQPHLQVSVKKLLVHSHLSGSHIGFRCAK